MAIEGFKTDDPTLDRIEHLCRRLADSLGNRFIKEERWQSFAMYLLTNLLIKLHECVIDNTPKQNLYSVSSVDELGIIIHTWLVPSPTTQEALTRLKEHFKMNRSELRAGLILSVTLLQENNIQLLR